MAVVNILTYPLNTLRPIQNGRHLADDAFKRSFLSENVRISVEMALKFIPTCPINTIPAMVQTSRYLNQWWLDYRRIYASLGLNELMLQGLISVARTLVAVRGWCHQITSHYLDQYCIRFMTPWSKTVPTWIQNSNAHCIPAYYIAMTICRNIVFHFESKQRGFPISCVERFCGCAHPLWKIIKLHFSVDFIYTSHIKSWMTIYSRHTVSLLKYVPIYANL